jgi:protein SCO1/2
MMRLASLCLALCLASATAASAFDPFAAATIEPRAGARVPLDLRFRDERGRTVSLRELGAGKPLVLAPVLHDCPNICGVTLGGLADAVAGQSYRAGPDFRIVAFSIDPHETPPDARKSIAALGKRVSGDATKAGWHAVTGASADIAAVTDALGYRYAWDESIGQYAHVAAVAVLTPDGRLARWLYGLAPDPGDLRLALTEAGEGRIGGLGDRLLLLCYRYDPATGRYSPLIWSLLRTASAGTAMFLLGAVLFAVRRERRAGGRRA